MTGDRVTGSRGGGFAPPGGGERPGLAIAGI